LLRNIALSLIWAEERSNRGVGFCPCIP
jgi:hypothetical protein